MLFLNTKGTHVCPMKILFIQKYRVERTFFRNERDCTQLSFFTIINEIESKLYLFEYNDIQFIMFIFFTEKKQKVVEQATCDIL